MKTRMHSSRMLTGRSLTICLTLLLGGRGIPKESRNQKNFPPPKKLETPQKIGGPPKNWWPPPEKLETPRKIGPPKKLENPLKNWRHPPRIIGDPPEKLETPRNWRTPPVPDLQGMLGYPPPTPLLTESQTGVKILPWPNFIAAGKN